MEMKRMSQPLNLLPLNRSNITISVIIVVGIENKKKQNASKTETKTKKPADEQKLQLEFHVISFYGSQIFL